MLMATSPQKFSNIKKINLLLALGKKICLAKTFSLKVIKTAQSMIKKPASEEGGPVLSKDPSHLIRSPLPLCAQDQPRGMERFA